MHLENELLDSLPLSMPAMVDDVLMFMKNYATIIILGNSMGMEE